MGRATTPGNSVSCRRTRGEDRGKREGRAPYGDAWMARSSLRRSRVRQVGRAAADHGDVWVVHDGLTDRDELGVDVLGPHIAVMGSCHWPDVQRRPTAAAQRPFCPLAAHARAARVARWVVDFCLKSDFAFLPPPTTLADRLRVGACHSHPMKFAQPPPLYDGRQPRRQPPQPTSNAPRST